MPPKDDEQEPEPTPPPKPSTNRRGTRDESPEDDEKSNKRQKFSVARNDAEDTRRMPPPSSRQQEDRASSCRQCASFVNPIPKEWSIGVHFKFLNNTAHRVYEGPPDGTPRVRLSSEELHIDFDKIYQVKGIYADKMWTAVSFEVIPTPEDRTKCTITSFGYDGSAPRDGAVTVWSNVRKNHVWWAKPFICRSDHEDRNYPSGSS